LPKSLSSQVCVAPFALHGLQSRVSDSAMIDKPEPRRFPPPWSVEEIDGGLLVTDVDPAAQSRAPSPAGSVASTAAAAATAAPYQTSYQQAHAATAATAPSATTNCTAAAPAAAYMAAA